MSNTHSGPPGTGAADMSPRPSGAGSPDGAAPEGPPSAAPALRGELGAPAPARPRIGDTRPARLPVAPAPLERPPLGAVARPVRARTLAPLDPSPDSARHDGDENGTDGSDAEGNGTGDGTGAKRSRGRRRSGRDRKGKSVGRYLVCVSVRPHATQIAMLEGRTLVDHYVSRASDETTQIDGNIYWGRVQNVLPGMEAAFIDIGVPKNAVLYRGDVRYDKEDVEGGSSNSGARIEDVLRPGQSILCQVTKNPIGAKGARLTQEVSLPGRFAVLVPNSSAFGISKRLGDTERKRLRRIVDDVRPEGHGLIVRTAAEGASHEELQRDVEGLVEQWVAIEAASKRSDHPRLLYREPDLAVRMLREELNGEYRAVVIDDRALYEQVRDYVGTVSPA